MPQKLCARKQKICYPSRRLAEIARRHTDPADTTLMSYKCYHCGCWHTGHGDGKKMQAILSLIDRANNIKKGDGSHGNVRHNRR